MSSSSPSTYIKSSPSKPRHVKAVPIDEFELDTNSSKSTSSSSKSKTNNNFTPNLLSGLLYEFDVNGDIYDEISSFLENDTTTPFDSSQLYSSLSDSKFVDKSFRESEYRLYTDSNLFDKCQHFIDIANQKVKSINGTQFLL